MRFLFTSLLAAGSAALVLAQEPARPKAPQDEASYIGASSCRSCHRSKAKGEQFVHWSTKTPHPEAVETLASAQAAAVAARLGIAEPQKDPACLRCHQTAFGVDPKRLEKSFKPDLGVQCESCHGPGSAHKEARLKAAAAIDASAAQAAANTTLEIPKGEIRLPDETLCRSCHNQDSPTYKPYTHKEFLVKVAHPNPQRPRPPEPLHPPAGG